MENDASCATLGEMQYGITKNENHYVMLTLGTGVGGGIVINRQLFIGGNGNSAEFGHSLSRLSEIFSRIPSQESVSTLPKLYL